MPTSARAMPCWPKRSSVRVRTARPVSLRAPPMRQARGASALRALVEGYLSDRHLGDDRNRLPGGSAGLGNAAPVARGARGVSATGARPGRRRAPTLLPQDAQADSGPAIASQLVGALQLARALGDNAEGQALLKASRRALLGAVRPPTSDLNETASLRRMSSHQKYDDHHDDHPPTPPRQRKPEP